MQMVLDASTSVYFKLQLGRWTSIHIGRWVEASICFSRRWETLFFVEKGTTGDGWRCWEGRFFGFQCFLTLGHNVTDRD